MKKRLGLFVAAAALSIAAVAPVGAASDNHATLGTPGEPNCQGQTLAYLAQNRLADVKGIGNVAEFFNLSVKEAKAIVDAYCA